MPEAGTDTLRRIALVGPLPPYRGGIAHFHEATARGLEGRGHTVRRYTFCRQYPERLFPGRTQFEPSGAVPPSGVDTPRVLDALDPRTWWRTADRLAQDGMEAAVFPYWMSFFAPAFGTLVRRLVTHGIPSVGLVHNALPHERRPGDKAFARYALGRSAGLVVLSDQVREDVEGLRLNVPVRQVAHPLYDGFGDPIPKAEARAALGLDPDGPVFLFFGFIRRYKGLHVLLEAMPSVLAQRPDARLVVAGEFYADEDALRAQAAPLGDAVRLDADYIPEDRVGLYFSAADAVVQPYVTATQSGVAQIAFHFGTPVITTDVGGLAEIVPDGDAGLVVPPEDPAALAAALVRFVQDGLADRLAEGVLREREHYSWDRVLDAVETLLGEALA